MDREVIEQKLESLRRCLNRVQKKCPIRPETLGLDPDLQDIITLNLTRAVQLCVDIGAHLIAGMEDSPPPETMGKTFDILAQASVIPEALAFRLKKSVGFRNIAVHNYEAIDWTIVHPVIIFEEHFVVGYASRTLRSRPPRRREIAWIRLNQYPECKACLARLL